MEKKNSDLDIFILGEHNKQEIKRISKNIGIEISIKQYPTEIFEKTAKTDLFLKEVLKKNTSCS